MSKTPADTSPKMDLIADYLNNQRQASDVHQQLLRKMGALLISGGREIKIAEDANGRKSRVTTRYKK